ncbi:MAG: L-2-hydroxyglutarate oxidase [Solirubrobacteraceae bacterium]
MSDRVDLLVVGAGLVGLATARAFLEQRPDARVLVVDKEPQLAMHQSGRNSGVIHAGLYYAPGSLKAKLCREGRQRLLQFADEHGIPYRLCGKLVVALDDTELPRLAELARRGRENGICGLRELSPDEFREIEPNIAGVRALHVPESGVIDFKEVTAAYADDVRRRGGEIRLNARVSEIETRQGERVVGAGSDEIVVRQVAVCAGVHSDRLARLTARDDGRYRIAPFRGDYFVLSDRAAALVNGLVYPVPDLSFPFLGVHFTRRMDGQVWAGPNAVPSLHREGYSRFAMRPRDAFELLGYPGLWRLARRYYRTGVAEIWRDTVKQGAVANMRRYLPALERGDVSVGPCGIRAQVLARDGALLDDFILEHRGDVLHVVNAPSPAATASLAIGSRISAELLAATAD